MTAIQVLHPDLVSPPHGPFRLITGGAGGRQRAVFRRRRIVAVLLALAVVAACVAVGQAAIADLGSDPAGGEPTPASLSADAPAVVVAPGDTLWAIARRLRTGGDVRATVDRLAALHGPGPLVPGERLVVGPSRAAG